MSTVAPPPPTLPPRPPKAPPPPVQRSPARLLAVSALLVAAAVIAYLVLSAGNGITYQLLFVNAGQLVKGDQVQVGGAAVGTIKDIQLTSDNLARVTVVVHHPLAPLHVGTTAQIRATSLSGVANRYIALSPGPNNAPRLPDGATLSTTSTQGVVDIDQLFNTLDPRTRAALAQVIQGSATQYAHAARALRQSSQYFAPTLQSTDRLVSELERDQISFTYFLIYSSRAVTAIAARSPQLASLVANADQTFGAIGNQSNALTRSLQQLPPTLRQGTATLTALNPTLGDLTRLVNASKPNTTALTTFLDRLGPVLGEAVTPTSQLSSAISRPGPNNDLTDATRNLPALQSALESASPDTVAALRSGTPITAFLRPYTPDLVGWLRDFGQVAAYYDADGHYARVSAVFGDFAPGPTGALVPTTPTGGLAPLVTGQLSRCPGASTQTLPDHSNPFTDGGQLDCTPTQMPPG